jgi:hypothetical protein
MAPKRAPSSQLEHLSQAALMDWASLVRLPDDCGDVQRGSTVADYLFAIPNGGFRSKTTAGKLKAEGVKPGVWDLLLPLARCGQHGLWVEMKAPDGRPSVEQLSWGDKMDKAGYGLVICYSVDDAIREIKAYLDL